MSRLSYGLDYEAMSNMRHPCYRVMVVVGEERLCLGMVFLKHQNRGWLANLNKGLEAFRGKHYCLPRPNGGGMGVDAFSSITEAGTALLDLYLESV